MINWREQASTSHFQTAVAIRDRLRSGAIVDASAGIEELIDALSRSDKRALKSQLVRLMVHILKWKNHPEGRCRSWSSSIRQTREEVRDIQKETPSLTDDVVRALWPRCLSIARDEAATEMECNLADGELSWDEVFPKA